MPELALLTVQRDEDDSWRWTAYGERGERLGWQERCTDLGHALEEAIKWLHPNPEPAQASAPAQPRKAKVQRPGRQKPRRLASGPGRR